MRKVKSYPRIKLEYSDKYIPLIEEDGRDVSVIYYKNANTTTDITALSTIVSLDSNILIDDNKMIPIKEGSSTIQAVYNGMVDKQEFIVYDSFFKDNYKMHFIPEFDRVNMQRNLLFKSVFDTLMEFYDILYAYQKDIEGIKNPTKTKAKFLRILFSTFGFPNADFEHEETIYALISQRMYRNLLGRMLDILDIRGTYSAYELFFGALGYDIEIFEFWYDGNGYLVEVNSTNPEESTFDKYDIYGRRLDERYQTYEDPRVYIDPSNTQNYYNKSKYIRVLYTRNDNVPSAIVKSSQLIKEYLDFLKPLHLDYLTEMTQKNITDEYLETEESIIVSKTTIVGDDDDIIPELFSPTGKIITFSGNAYLTIKEFVSEGNVITFSGESENDYFSDEYSFESDGSNISFLGESYLDGVFISNGSILTFDGVSENSYRDSTWDPRTQGPQIGKAIHWYDYITQYQRDRGYTGWVAGYPADFFGPDFTHTPESETFNEIITVSPIIKIQDVFQTTIRFDQGWSYDDPDVYFDSFLFIISTSTQDNPNVYPNKLGASEVEDYYITTKASNPQEEGETEEEYEDRIKILVLNYFNNLNGSGIGLHPDIYNQKIELL